MRVLLPGTMCVAMYAPAGVQLYVWHKAVAHRFALLLWARYLSTFVCFLWRQGVRTLRWHVASEAAQHCTAAAFVRRSGVCPQLHVLPAVLPAQDLTTNVLHMHESRLLLTVFQQLCCSCLVLPNCAVYAGVALLACRALGAFYP
jgi:hypothetical protein